MAKTYTYTIKTPLHGRQRVAVDARLRLLLRHVGRSRKAATEVSLEERKRKWVQKGRGEGSESAGKREGRIRDAAAEAEGGKEGGVFALKTKGVQGS